MVHCVQYIVSVVQHTTVYLYVMRLLIGLAVAHNDVSRDIW